MAFPRSFGFIPGTKAEDGDPVDILVLSHDDLPVGTLVKVQLLGVIEAEQTEDGKTCRNDRLIGKVAQSHSYRDITSLEPLGDRSPRPRTPSEQQYSDRKLCSRR
jgi:inorganic pyrophosphatase